MPAYNTPKSFPGVDKLPPLAQTLLQRLFPPDQLPTPSVVTGPGQAMPIVRPDMLPLQEALRPWGKGLEQAYPHLYGPSEVPMQPAAYGDYLKSLLNFTGLLSK